jgi:hypothetical protein
MNAELEQIAKDVVDASMKLHMAMGPRPAGVSLHRDTAEEITGTWLPR